MYRSLHVSGIPARGSGMEWRLSGAAGWCRSAGIRKRPPVRKSANRRPL